MVIKLLRYLLLFFSLFLTLAIPQAAYAHAVLEKAVPAQGSHLPSSPKEIVLSFNERLESELFSLKLFDDSGKEASKTKAKLSGDQRQLSLSLPNLANGNYTISYHVISADGHPVKGSYMFSIGEGVSNKRTPALLQQDNQSSTITFAIRIFYYLALLFVTGWILWGRIAASEDIKQRNQKTARFLQAAFLIANIGFGISMASGYLEQWNMNSIISMLIGTTAGLSWVITVVLSLLGFSILLRHPWLDRSWVLLMLVAKSVNGHAFAFEPRLLTISLDVIHLLAAAIWSGGLLYVLLYFKKFREHIRHFLGVFSKAAFISIMVLVSTGTAATLLYLPKWQYVFVTQWGTFLLIKAGLVLLVIVVACIIRYYLKKQNEGPSRRWVQLDFALMLSILCITGILTSLSPIPENKPLNWHENVEEMEFTTNILPKVPGTNTFMVEANSHEEGLGIKRIELILIYNDNSEVAPIRVPLEGDVQGKYAHFMTDGNYLPFSGNWTVEVRILDSEDNEKVYQKDFVVY
ncbi:copper resistance CopC/CopD family protein [Neobacillus niacini]|uniref:copper resistance CopC/CopD family protein n=1 Tax=Neobacillus niacini TaxID=86668 RepID=UPI0021CB94BB|nr:copper resistance protein CopC/CopD [Neobacillus niacini]MCM3767578.1 copper resistance protein CopC/CopD [Neobacillus niacini]